MIKKMMFQYAHSSPFKIQSQLKILVLHGTPSIQYTTRIIPAKASVAAPAATPAAADRVKRAGETIYHRPLYNTLYNM